MNTYTVIGVWDHEGSDDTDLIIAGVVEGQAKLVDSGASGFGVYTRFAASVEAESPDDAESQVIAEYNP